MKHAFFKLLYALYCTGELRSALNLCGVLWCTGESLLVKLYDVIPEEASCIMQKYRG